VKFVFSLICYSSHIYRRTLPVGLHLPNAVFSNLLTYNFKLLSFRSQMWGLYAMTLSICLSVCLFVSPSVTWNAYTKMRFLPRDATHKRGLCRHAVSVCVCVCLSRSWLVSKRINISSNFFSPLDSQAILVFRTKRHGNIRIGWEPPPPLVGASNAGGVGRNRDSEPISGFIAYC